MRDRIRLLLALAELTESAASEAIGKQRSYLNAVFSETIGDPGSSAIDALAELFGCTTDYLIRGDGRTPSKAAVQAAVAAAQERAKGAA
jgi:transcriptional regulator with XRE-family HTH domain